jgi:hypothetical protein
MGDRARLMPVHTVGSKISCTCTDNASPTHLPKKGACASWNEKGTWSLARAMLKS